MTPSLNSIISIPGSSGLFKVVRPIHRGLLIETLDERKVRSVKSVNSHQFSSLEDISIYTTGEEDTMPLATVLRRLYSIFTGVIPEDQYDSLEKLQAILHSVVPNYDRDRVYVSNIKKVVCWYNILAKHLPGLLKVKAPSKEEKVPEGMDAKD
ncbi:MAG: DUF5606 domain-containing protein [Bacteroidota bacterium]